jgi:hypothetical protein
MIRACDKAYQVMKELRYEVQPPFDQYLNELKKWLIQAI